MELCTRSDIPSHLSYAQIYTYTLASVSLSIFLWFIVSRITNECIRLNGSLFLWFRRRLLCAKKSSIFVSLLYSSILVFFFIITCLILFAVHISFIVGIRSHEANAARIEELLLLLSFLSFFVAFKCMLATTSWCLRAFNDRS